jgi:two-component system chemotaxis response regulator CheB
VSAGERIRVVVVDDSPFVCRLLTSRLEASPDIAVVASANDGERAVALVHELRPDVVTLDLQMDGMSGLDALDRIVREMPTPVIVVSGLSREAADAALQAVRLGAVDFVLKYTPGADTDPETLGREITSKVRAASRVKVIRARGSSGLLARKAAPSAPTPRRGAPPTGMSVVVIGASTGGPVALRELLSNLPADFPAAVVVVQHIPASFTGVLAAQLDRQVPMRVREAAAGETLRVGVVLIAPGDRHLRLRSSGRVELTSEPEVGGHRPSIDVTMRSAAEAFGAAARGVVLTGMGSDGALGMAAIRERGGRTYAQDSASCVVDSMPRAAAEGGAASRVAPPADIARMLRADVARAREERV